MILPIKFNIYKGLKGRFGALQFSFQPAHYYCTNKACRTKNFNGPEQLCNCKDAAMSVREGNIFVEGTSASGPNQYNWDNKVIMALSVSDMSKLMIGIRAGEETRLLHDPGAGTESKGKRTKILQFQSPKGTKAGGIITLTESNDMSGEQNKSHTVPVTQDECAALVTLFQIAIGKCLAWV